MFISSYYKDSRGLFFSLLMLGSLQFFGQSLTVVKDPNFTGTFPFNPTLPPSTAPLANASNAVDNLDTRIFPSANPQSEIHLSINKWAPSNILVSAQTYFGLGNSNQGYYYTNDGGTSWLGADILPNAGGGRGDPSTGFDAAGNGYLVTMGPNQSSNPDGYLVQRTTDRGTTWQTQQRGVGPVANFDKEMIACDNIPTSPNVNNFYAAWTDFNSPFSVRFNRSTNGGTTFSTPITLRNNFGQGTNVQTGPNGDVYVCWANYGTGVVPANGIGFSRSTDGGLTFTTAIPFAYSGIRTSGTNPLFNNTRVNDFPSMAVDKSCGNFRGRIYIAYPELENGNGKAIIRVRSSTDNGTTWSGGITVSIPAGRQNWFPWISVDDATGVVSVVYYSLDAATGFSTNTYVAYSMDGGTTFTNLRVSDVAHITAPIPGFGGGYAGDYIGITSYAGKAYASWSDDRNGTWQVYVSRLDYDCPILFSSANTVTTNGPTTYGTFNTNVRYEATTSITSPSTNTFTVNTGANVTMIAGSRIQWLPGFRANQGSIVRAYLGTVNICKNANARQSANEITKTEYESDGFICYPNPTTNNLTFEYNLTESTDVNLSLFDFGGKEISIIRNIKQDIGINKIEFDGKSVPTGTYIYKFVAGDRVKTGKILKVD